MSEMSIQSRNKIISKDLLLEIFDAMHDEYEKCKQIAAEEKAKNEPFQLQYQKWTLHYFSGDLKFTVYYLDDHSVMYDNYQTFTSIFKNQIHSIKRIYVDYTMSYNKPGPNNEFGDHMYNSLHLTIDTDKVEVSANLASGDHYMEEVYNLITQKIANAPEKYDRLIRGKEFINFKIGLPLGLIMGMVLVSATVFIPQLREFYQKYFFMFPALILLLGLVLSVFVGNMRTAANYAKLIPKKYGGYDVNTNSSYYNDDIQKLTETSEVLIGEKANNQRERDHIAACERQSMKFLPIAFGITAIVTLIMFFVTR